MKIKDEEYEGYRYTINFVDSLKGGWSEWHLHTFYITSPHAFYSEHHATLADAEAEVKQQIEDFLMNVPASPDGWIGLLSECVIADGYEVWHIDRDMAIHVLELYNAAKLA